MPLLTYTPAELATRYKPIGIIGEGAFGKVEVVQFIPSGVFLARKSHRLFAKRGANNSGLIAELISKFRRSDQFSDSSLQQAAQRINREASNLKLFQGTDPILQLFEFYQTEDRSGHIVTELCNGGTVSRLINDRRITDPNDRYKTFRTALQRIVAGVDLLHSRGVKHRDIKPNNILLRTPFSADDVAIADFGLSKVLGSNSITLSNYFTPPYSSPEQLRDFSKVTPRGDIFSTAIVLAEIISGRTALSEIDAQYKLRGIRRRQLVDLLAAHDMRTTLRKLLAGFGSTRLVDVLVQAVGPKPTLRADAAAIGQVL